MEKTIYTDTYSYLRKAVILHLESGEYKNDEKRKLLAQKFYDAEKVTYSIEEKELHEYLSGSGDPIYESDYMHGEEYIEFLVNTIKIFNSVLPDQINIPEIKT